MDPVLLVVTLCPGHTLHRAATLSLLRRDQRAHHRQAMQAGLSYASWLQVEAEDNIYEGEVQAAKTRCLDHQHQERKASSGRQNPSPVPPILGAESFISA